MFVVFKNIMILLSLMCLISSAGWSMQEEIQEKKYIKTSQHREPKIYYRNDEDCFCVPSCCNFYLLEAKPKQNDIVRCTTKHHEKIKYNFEIENIEDNICEYHAIFDSDQQLKVIHPHSDFCWENESYLYRCFCCIITCGIYKGIVPWVSENL